MSKESEQYQPNELPPQLDEFLRSVDFAWVMEQTSLGTLFVFKAPAREIESIRGTVPVNVTHELYQTEFAPVIRSLIRWFDQPQQPLSFETFTNVRSDSQRQEFSGLANQPDYLCAFYDEAIQQRLAKRVRNTNQERIRMIAERASMLAQEIPEEDYDFDKAKDLIVRQTLL